MENISVGFLSVFGESMDVCVWSFCVWIHHDQDTDVLGEEMIKFAVWLLIIFLVLFLPGLFLSIKYRNPYKLIFIFGKKGAGKTTMLTKLAYKYNKKGISVYCNTEIPGTYLFDAAKDVGFVKFPEDSVIMIDEVSLIWDNRNFKAFKPEVGRFFRLQRHHRNTVYVFSQTFDVDKKIRDQCDKMYLLTNYFGWLSYAKEIKRKLTVVHPSEEAEARITDDLEIPPFWLILFGSREFIFVPHWARYFDSHLIEEPLPEKIFPYQPYAPGMDPRKEKKKHDQKQSGRAPVPEGLDTAKPE